MEANLTIKTETRVKKLVFDDIEIEVDCYGRGDYQFFSDEMQVETDGYTVDFSLEVHSDGNGNDNFYPDNIKVWHDEDIVETEGVEEAIIKACRIVSWCG